MADSYVEINLDHLGQNVRSITQKYHEYRYFIGVVKSDAYGHGMRTVTAMAANGVNYFAVATLEEARELRRYDSTTPVLLLEPIVLSRIAEAEELALTLSVHTLEYARALCALGRSFPLKVHLQVDSGLNRLGFKDKNELHAAYELLRSSVYRVEGIYQHFATAGVFDPYWDRQVRAFLDITSLLDLSAIPMVHMGNGVALMTHPKLAFANGIRMGLVMYGYNVAPAAPGRGLTDCIRVIRNFVYRKWYHLSPTYSGVELALTPAMTLKARILQIKDVKKGERIGYGAAFRARCDLRLAVLAIGYGNGLGHRNLGRTVAINGKTYPIVGAISMNMIAVQVDDSIRPENEAIILGAPITLGAFSRGAGLELGESLVSLGNNTPRVYVKNDGKRD